MALNNRTGGSNSFGTGYVDTLFRKQFNFSPRKTDKDTIERIYNALETNRKRTQLPEVGKRSFLDRSFDALLTANYAVAGAVDGAIRDDKTVLGGIIGGIKAGNPFGKGFEEGETTFSDVIRSGLDKAGIDAPKGFLGKATVGTAGFALDVLLDPTTYLTFGTSALLKGTGKVGTATKTIEKLAQEYPQFATGLREAGALTDEVAESIVKVANGGKEMSKAQLASEVQQFKSKYNALIGVDRSSSKGITFGIQNAPFGDKIAKKLGIKSQPTTLLSAKGIQETSDLLGISRGYQALRNGIYGSRIGAHLSSNAGLKRLAELNPAKLYEYVGAVNAISGKNLDKIARDKEIREIGIKLLNLSPSEHKDIIKALETPSLWKTVKDNLKLAETERGKLLKQQYEQQASKLNAEISDATTLRDDILKASDEELADYKIQVDLLARNKDLTPKQSDELLELQYQIDDLLKYKSELPKRSDEIAKLQDELKQNDLKYKRMYELEGEEVAISKFNDLEPAQIADHFDGFLSGLKGARELAKEDPNKLGNLNLYANDLREEVSTLLFGKADFLPRDTDAKAIEELATIIQANYKDGADLDAVIKASNAFLPKELKNEFLEGVNTNNFQSYLREFIENNPQVLGNTNVTLYKHLANKYGYSSIQSVIGRHNELQELLRRDKNLRTGNNPVLQEFEQLAETITKRNAELAQLKKLSPKELTDYLEAQKLSALRDELDYLLYGDVDLVAKHKDAINKYSEGAIGAEKARIGYYGNEQFTDPKFQGMTRAEAELNRFRITANDKKYTLADVMPDKDSVVESLLHSRQKRVFENSATPQALSQVGALRDAKRVLEQSKQDYATLLKAYRDNPTDELKDSIKNVKEAYQKSFEDFNDLKNKVKNNTNYAQALKQSRQLSPSEVKFIDDQAEAIVTLANKMFPYHHYKDLTSAQKNLLNTNAYYAVRDNKGKLGIEELMTKHYEENILPRKKQQVKKAFQESQEKLVSETLDVGTGIKLETDKGTVSAIITSKDEAKVKKTRTETNVKYEDGGDEIFIQKQFKKGEKHPFNGKVLKSDKTFVVPQKPPSKRVESTKNIEYEESLGYYNFTARLSDGTEVKVDPTKVRGTYVEEMSYETKVLPAFTKAELDDTLAYSAKLRRKIGGLKGVETKSAKRVQEADKMLEELVQRKQVLESQYNDLNGINKTIEDNILKIKNAQALNDDKVAGLNKTIDELIESRDKILNALDDADAFELMVKRDLGDSEFNKLLDDVNITESKRIGLDDAKFPDVVKFYAKSLREEFTKAGLDEIAIGKLNEDAFKEMVNRYFPRTLTQDAKAFFKANPTQAEKYGAVSNDFGFGSEWNPYSKGRNEAIRKLSTVEANNYFESEIGLRIFEENVGTAYMNRMLKNSDVIYDEKAMQDLMYRFGHFVGEKPMDGYSVVVNYGALRKYIRELNNETAKRDIYEFLNEDAIVKQKLAEMGGNTESTLASIEKLGTKNRSKEEIKKGLDEIFEKHTANNISKLGLDPSIIKGETTPLIKIDATQAQLFRDNGGEHLVRQINDITIGKLNQQRLLTMERDEKQLLKLYDKFLTFIKLNQTTIMPSFWVQTKIGNTFQGWMGVGRDVFDVAFNKQALDAIRNADDLVKLRNMKPVVSEDGKIVKYWDELVQDAKTYGVINRDFLTKDFAGHSFSEGTKVLPAKLDPFNTTEFFAYKAGGKITSNIDNSDRLLQFASLIKQGKTPAQASETVTKHLFDYGDLTDFEKRVMKRIFPYYTWMRKNNPLILRQLIDEPEKMQLVAKIHSAINSSNGEDEVDRDFVTGFARDFIQLPFNITNKDGTKEPVLFNPKLPYQDLRNIPIGDGDGNVIRDYFNQSTPLLKIPIELATNWNSFFDAPLAKEDGPQLTPRLLHVASQFSAFNAVNNFLKAEGDDKVLAFTNAFSGVKLTSYDVEANKEDVYKQAYKEQFQEGIALTVGKGVVRFAQALEGKTKETLSDIAVELVGRPFSANDQSGDLIPITQERYNELNSEERKKYELDDKTRTYLNKRAKELEEKQYKEAGVAKKFLWTLIEGEYPGGQTVARINRVVDGDTLRANVNGKDTAIRLLLVNTPESVGEYKDNPQPGGVEASAYTKSLVLGKDVKLYIDGKDKYGRLTAFVEVGGTDVGEELVGQGLARTEYASLAKGNYPDRLNRYNDREVNSRVRNARE